MLTDPVSSLMFMAGLLSSLPVSGSKKAIPAASGITISLAEVMMASTSTACLISFPLTSKSDSSFAALKAGVVKTPLA